jgi:hypothetical protein
MNRSGRQQASPITPCVSFPHHPLSDVLRNHAAALGEERVKELRATITKAQEAKSEIPSVKYQVFLTAGVERWKRSSAPPRRPRSS